MSKVKNQDWARRIFLAFAEGAITERERDELIALNTIK